MTDFLRDYPIKNSNATSARLHVISVSTLLLVYNSPLLSVSSSAPMRARTHRQVRAHTQVSTANDHTLTPSGIPQEEHCCACLMSILHLEVQRQLLYIHRPFPGTGSELHHHKEEQCEKACRLFVPESDVILFERIQINCLEY